MPYKDIDIAKAAKAVIGNPDCFSVLSQFYNHLGIELLPYPNLIPTVRITNNPTRDSLIEKNEELYLYLKSLGQEVAFNYAIAGDLMIFGSQTCVFPGIYLGSDHLLCVFDKGAMVVPLKFFRQGLIEKRRIG